MGRGRAICSGPAGHMPVAPDARLAHGVGMGQHASPIPLQLLPVIQLETALSLHQCPADGTCLL